MYEYSRPMFSNDLRDKKNNVLHLNKRIKAVFIGGTIEAIHPYTKKIPTTQTESRCNYDQTEKSGDVLRNHFPHRVFTRRS